MIPYTLYRHPKMTDVAFTILAQENIDNNRQELCVMWWNIGSCHEPWCMHVTQTLYVTNDWLQELVSYPRGVS